VLREIRLRTAAAKYPVHRGANHSAGCL
jgi:hypothetical protein